MTTLNPVRRGAHEYFNNNSCEGECVKINAEAVTAFVDKLLSKEYRGKPLLPDKPPSWDWPPLDVPNSEAMDYFAIVDASNYCFWYFNESGEFKKYEADCFYGAEAMEVVVRDNWGEFKPKNLGLMTLERLHELFDRTNKEGNKYTIPLIEERLELWHALASDLNKKGYESFNEYFNDFFINDNKLFNKGRGLLERIIKDFPASYGSDVEEIDGRKYRIDKRAQLLLGRLYGRFYDKGLFKLIDVEELTLYADYQLPKVFEAEGLMNYCITLKDVIESREVLTNHEMIAEIRLATIYLGDLIVGALRKRGIETNCLLLDKAVWALGRDEAEYPQKIHLDKTTAY